MSKDWRKKTKTLHTTLLHRLAKILVRAYKKLFDSFSFYVNFIDWDGLKVGFFSYFIFQYFYLNIISRQRRINKMMRQAEQPQLFLVNDNHSECTSDLQALDDEDLLRVLLDQSRSTSCNSSLKKKILLGIYEKRVAIIKKYEELDGLHLGVDLATRFTSLLIYFLRLKVISKGGKSRSYQLYGHSFQNWFCLSRQPSASQEADVS